METKSSIAIGIFKRKKLVFVLVLGVSLLLGIYGIIDFLFLEDAEPYFITAYYEDTGIVPMENYPGSLTYGPKKGHCTLVLRRGCPHSTITTGHGYSENLSIELQSRPDVGRIELRETPVKVAFSSYFVRTFWTLGQEGVSGYVDVHSVEEDQVLASYHILVDARDDYSNQNRSVVYSGESQFFIRKPRPTSEVIAGDEPAPLPAEENGAH